MVFRRQTILIAIVLLLAAMVAGFNIAILFVYSKARDSLDRSLGNRLLSIARAVAPEIEGEVESDLALGELSLSTMTRLSGYFEQVSAADELSGVFLLDSEGNDLLSWEDTVSPIEVYLPLYSESFDRARLGEAGVSQLYRVDQRYFKSAFHPLGTDSTAAVLVVESAFRFFDDFSDFRDRMLAVNLIAIAFLVSVGVVIVYLNRKLVRAEQLLVSQAALSQMGQMAAIIAHEVRNPLAIIKATAERAKKKYGIEKSDELFDFISEEVDRLNETTWRYLQFASAPEVSSSTESVAAIIDSVVEGLNRQLSSQGVSLHKSVADELQEIEINSARLRQILINLLRNAAEASADGGKLTLSASGSRTSGEVLIEIRDSGCGLRKRELAHIFDPFYTTKPRGSGLGLFVVKRLVEELGGEVAVHSELGVGTTFTIRLRGKSDG